MSNSIYLWDNLSRGISGFSVLPETIGALSVYAVVGLEPALVLDFDDTYYRTGGTDTDLVSAANHTRANNATMVDSNGLLKWGPHNLLTYSEEFDNAAWTKTNVTVTANATTDPNGGTRLDTPATGVAGYGVYGDIQGNSFVFAISADPLVIGAGTTIWLDTDLNRSTGYLIFGFTGGAEYNINIAIDGVARLYSGSAGQTFVSELDHAISVDGSGFEVTVPKSLIGNPEQVRIFVDVNDTVFLPNDYSNVDFIVGAEPVAVGAYTLDGDLGDWTLGNSADIIVPSATLAEHKVRSLPTLKATDYTVSVFAKAAGYDYFVFREDINGTFVNTFFNLSAGSIVSTGAGRTSAIEDAGGGWYKCSIAATATASAKDIGFGVSANGTDVSFTGNGTSGIFLWGAHLYRSDLGGMVANPARGDSYVPTTDSAVYLPRVGHHLYNGSAWVDAGYFHESEARTNLLTYSSEFDNVDWTKNLNVSITANAIASPDGTTNADLAEQTGGTFTAVSQPITLVSGSTYTLSLFMKANTAATARLRVISGSTDVNLLAIDLENGTSSSYQAEDYGSGWFRYALSFVADGTTGLVFIYPADSSADLGSTGIYGAQVEAGSTPSSYIPTAGATVPRAADAMTIPADNLPYSATAMSIQMEGTMTGVSSTFANWTEDASNGILMQSGASNFTFTQEAAGVVDTVTGGSYTSGINVPFNIASRHGSTFINGAVDGTALTADTTPVALPDLLATDMDIGSTFMGTIKLFRVWADDLTDAGNEEATT